MPIGSQYQSVRFTISVAQPLIEGGAHLYDLSVDAQQYQHSISAFGGFDTASFGVAQTIEQLQDWFENGLGRHITTYDDSLAVMWQGFVNEVTIRQAGLELTRGPLVEITNALAVVYSGIDTSTSPPTPGVRKKTATAIQSASQARWGVWPKVLSIAGATDDNAVQIRDSHLAEYSEPETNSAFSFAAGDVSLSVNCLGYMHTLRYPYNNTSVTGTQDASAKIKAILSAAPNNWISSDQSGIATNTLAVKAWENDDELAMSLIRGVTAMGDADENRWLFGIYEDRRAIYEAAPDVWEYRMQLNDGRRTIVNRTGGEVPPWSVRPGKWIFFADFLPGRISDATRLRDDPRMLFIEGVTYNMPNGLDLNGGKLRRLNQKLARLGLGGTSV